MLSLRNTMRLIIDQLKPASAHRPKKARGTRRCSVAMMVTARRRATQATTVAHDTSGLDLEGPRLTLVVNHAEVQPASAAAHQPLRLRVAPGDKQLTVISGRMKDVCDALDLMIDAA